MENLQMFSTLSWDLGSDLRILVVLLQFTGKLLAGQGGLGWGWAALLTFHNSSHSRSSRAFLCLAVTALTSDCTTFAFISTCSATVWACSMLSWKSKSKLMALEGPPLLKRNI